MKKNIFLSLVLLLSAYFSAPVFSQVSFGVHAGGNLAFTKIELGGDNQSTDPKAGFTAGLVSEFQLGPVSLRPELNYIQKGFKSSSSFFGGTITTSSRATLHYVEVPVNITLNIPSKESHFFIGVGPVFSFGLSGKYKATGTIGSSSDQFNSKIKFDGEQNDNTVGDDDIHLKSFDFGVDGLLGYKLASGFTLSAGYTQGLSNIIPDDDTDDGDNVWKNSGLFLKIGYMFGGNHNEKTTHGGTNTGTF